MPTTRLAESAVLSGVAAALTGLGVLSFVFFPFSIPFLLVTAAFVAPLVILPVVAALPVAIAFGLARAIRAMGKRVRLAAQSHAVPQLREPICGAPASLCERGAQRTRDPVR